MGRSSKSKRFLSMNNQIDMLQDITSSVSSTEETLKDFNDNISSLNKILESMVDSDKSKEEERKVKESSDKIHGAMKQLGNRFLELAKVVADTANKYSQISNDLIQVSGASGSSVRNTRSEIVHDIISQINKETGNFFNPEKSYQKVVDIANQANIGNLEAIEAITRPILLASESMNINNGELASLMSKWYTRYNFSSREMESMVDEIRGNTAGNNATAEATLKNISSFQNFIGVYADSTEEMQNMVDAISQESSRLESVGINSGYIFDYMKQIGQGDTSNIKAIVSLLGQSGTGMSWTEAQELLRSGNAGDMKLVSDALAKGAQSIGEMMKNSSVSAEGIKAFGLDVEEIYNILSASGVLMESDEFLKSVEGAQTSTEAIKDKFNTHSDKLNNILSGFSEFFANFQENFGVAISDILKVLGFMLVAINLRGGTGSLANMIPGASQLIGGLSLGTIATAGGIAAGGLLAVDGIKGIFDEGSSTAEKAMSGAEFALGVGGAGLIGASAMGAVTTIGGLAAGPVGWAILAAGGLAFLGKKAYKDAHELSGNAQAINDQLDDIGDNLKNEAKERASSLESLMRDFNKETDVEKQRQLLAESNLFDLEDLNEKTTEEMFNMIKQYQSASDAFSNTTDDIVKRTKEFYGNKEDEQLKEFLNYLNSGSISDEDKKGSLVNLIGSEEANKLINSYSYIDANGDYVTDWNGIKKAVSKQDISSDAINSTNTWLVNAGYDNYRGNYYNSYKEEASLVLSTLSKLEDFATDEDTFRSLMEEIDSKGLREDLVSTARRSVNAIAMSHVWYKPEEEYRTGSNYIESDQTARIHEGEAVVPKKYNPAANITELEMLRKYYKNNTDKSQQESIDSLKEISSVILEIKEFLAAWKDDNIRRDNINRRTNKFSSASSYVSRYMTEY